MYTKLLIIAINFSFFVAHATEGSCSKYTLDDIPNELLTKIVTGEGVPKGKIIKYNCYKDCARLHNTKTLDDYENNLLLKKEIVTKNNEVAICAKDIAILSSVSKTLYNRLALLFKLNPILINSEIVFRPNDFSNLVINLMLNTGNVINCVNGGNTFTMRASISIHEETCNKTRKKYKFPALCFYGVLNYPSQELDENYTKSNNNPIVSAIKSFSNDSSFYNIHNLFNVILQEAFSGDTVAQEKLTRCLELCTYIYNHFNDFVYTESRKIINFESTLKSLETPQCPEAEFFLIFDMGPMDKKILPFHLFYNVLNI